MLFCADKTKHGSCRTSITEFLDGPGSRLGNIGATLSEMVFGISWG